MHNRAIILLFDLNISRGHLVPYLPLARMERRRGPQAQVFA